MRETERKKKEEDDLATGGNLILRTGRVRLVGKKKEMRGG